jgi:putative Ca2+/H+ antiporter (TMEM165/GDT1 family)
MTGFLEILVIAAVAQLTVLPGEKVQFIIAGLSTRYKPLLVVGAASSAFAGWTAVEILFGRALQQALPGVVLDAATAGLFLLFAVLLYRSAPAASSLSAETATAAGASGTSRRPQTTRRESFGGDEEGGVETGFWSEDDERRFASDERGRDGRGRDERGRDERDRDERDRDIDTNQPRETDGGVATGVPEVTPDFELFGRRIEGHLGQFLSIFSMMAVGEFGDKTQLVTIGLAAQYGATSAIWFGEMLVIVPVSLANAYFFHRFSHRFDVRKAHYAGATIFAFFGLDTVLAITTGFSVWEQIVGSVSNLLLAVL